MASSINDWLRSGESLYYSFAALSTSGLLVALLLWHVAQAFVKRLWLLPSHSSRILALNAGTLALLGIVAKPTKPGDNAPDSNSWPGDEYYMLVCSVLICATIGALMPSFAASTDLQDMWSNLLGVGLLVMSVNLITFLQFFYIPDEYYSGSSGLPTIHETVMEHAVVMASLFLLFLVLLVQAVALEAMMSDMKTTVLQRLDQLCMEFKAEPAYIEADVSVEKRAWSWEVVDQNTRIKLMMALTSDPQHVMSRSPAAAIVGALVLLCVTLFLKPHNGQLFLFELFQGQAVVVCGLICVWRWVRIALQEDRSFSSLVFAAEPSYWRRKVKNLQSAGPHSRMWGFQEVMWCTTAFPMLCIAVLFHRLLVAIIRSTHILSALLVQKMIWLPINTLRCSILGLCQALFQFRRSSNKVADSAVADVNYVTNFDSLGVVCLEGEDPRIVRREFVSAAKRITQRQLKKAEKKKADLKVLGAHLKSSFNASTAVAGKSKAILDAISQEGAPFIENLRVKHGYQFGWTLTVLSLLELLAKIEVRTLGESTVSEAAMNACRQAMDMMRLVDEQFVPCLVCSKEIYASACTSAWSALQKKKPRIFRWVAKKNQAQEEVRIDVLKEVLMATLRSTRRHIEDFNNAQRSSNHGTNHVFTIWSQQAVKSYTLHTVCQNLLTCWTNDVEATAAIVKGRGVQGSSARKMIEAMVEHINGLIGEVVACCLSNLPTAVDMSTTQAVQSGKISKIKKALVLVAQGKHLWEELQWPTLYSHRDTGLGQLKQWIH